MNKKKFYKTFINICLIMILALAMLRLLVLAFHLSRTAGAALAAIYIVSACYVVRCKIIEKQETRTRESEDMPETYNYYMEKRAAEKKAALEKLNEYKEAFDEEAAEAFMTYISPENNDHTQSVVKLVTPRRIEIHTFSEQYDWKSLDDDYFEKHYYETCASCTLDDSGINIQEHEWIKEI